MFGYSYVTGITFSSDFPTKNAYHSTLVGDQDVFISKFTTTGNLTFSTYLGSIYVANYPVLSSPSPPIIIKHSSLVFSSTRIVNNISFSFDGIFSILFLSILVLV